MLTQQQLATLKAAINADATMAAFQMTPDGYNDLAIHLNTVLATPDYFVWRTEVLEQTIFSNGMVWTEVDGLTPGKARIWEWMFKDGATNPSKLNVRNGIKEAWSGTQNRENARLVIMQHCQKLATKAEKAFGSGTGTTVVLGSGGSGGTPDTGPSTATYTDPITAADVQAARNLP